MKQERTPDSSAEHSDGNAREHRPSSLDKWRKRWRGVAGSLVIAAALGGRSAEAENPNTSDLKPDSRISGVEDLDTAEKAVADLRASLVETLEQVDPESTEYQEALEDLSALMQTERQYAEMVRVWEPHGLPSIEYMPVTDEERQQAMEKAENKLSAVHDELVEQWGSEVGYEKYHKYLKNEAASLDPLFDPEKQSALEGFLTVRKLRAGQRIYGDLMRKNGLLAANCQIEGAMRQQDDHMWEQAQEAGQVLFGEKPIVVKPGDVLDRAMQNLAKVEAIRVPANPKAEAARQATDDRISELLSEILEDSDSGEAKSD